MKTIISTHRDILRAVQGTNIWSGQQVQSYNSAAISWGALGKPMYAAGTQYAVRGRLLSTCPLGPTHNCFGNIVCAVYAPCGPYIPSAVLASAQVAAQVWLELHLHARPGR